MVFLTVSDQTKIKERMMMEIGYQLSGNMIYSSSRQQQQQVRRRLAGILIQNNNTLAHTSVTSLHDYIGGWSRIVISVYYTNLLVIILQLYCTVVLLIDSSVSSSKCWNSCYLSTLLNWGKTTPLLCGEFAATYHEPCNFLQTK